VEVMSVQEHGKNKKLNFLATACESGEILDAAVYEIRIRD